MGISTQNFSTIVANAVAAVQGAASVLVDFSVGAISLAFVQAWSGIALWLQAIALQVAALTRLSTSTGTDVDTFVNDYGYTRSGAVAAIGTVTLSRFTDTQQATVNAGVIVQTDDGTEQFQVVANVNSGFWNPSLNAYVIPAGTASADVSVQAVTAGAAGNVIAGAISVLGQSIVGIDTCTNAAPTSGGEDAESDAAVRSGFVEYLQSLDEGTKTACINAVRNLQTGATCTIVENFTYDGVAQASYFYAIVDDGTGSPSGAFLSSAYAAIDAVRAIGTSFGVFAPQVVTANITATITVASGFTGATVRTEVQAALTTYINTLADGVSLQWSRLFQIMYDSSAGVADVLNLQLNGGTSDLTATSKQVIKTGSVVLS